MTVYAIEVSPLKTMQRVHSGSMRTQKAAAGSRCGVVEGAGGVNHKERTVWEGVPSGQRPQSTKGCRSGCEHWRPSKSGSRVKGDNGASRFQTEDPCG